MNAVIGRNVIKRKSKVKPQMMKFNQTKNIIAVTWLISNSKIRSNFKCNNIIEKRKKTIIAPI